MTSATRRPLPTALFLALIPVAWLGVTVVLTGLEGLFGIFPSRFAAALKSFHVDGILVVVGIWQLMRERANESGARSPNP